MVQTEKKGNYIKPIIACMMQSVTKMSGNVLNLGRILMYSFSRKIYCIQKLTWLLMHISQ